LSYQAKNISGQIVLLTGAGGGIGRPLALRLAQLGCKVVCWDVAKQGEISLCSCYRKLKPFPVIYS